MTDKIVFIGCAGSGKSTLSCEVYLDLKKRGQNIELIPEWARFDIQRNGPMVSIWEQYRYLNNQRILEDRIPPSVELAICDSGVLASYFYSCCYADHLDARQRLVLKDMYGELLDDLYGGRYSLIFYLPLVDRTARYDGTRYQDDIALNTLDRHMELFFTKVHPVPNIMTLDRNYEGRSQIVLSKIAALLHLED